MKKLFKNYNFEFDKNERKILTTFSKQVLKQVERNNQYFGESKAFQSILAKIEGGDDVVKFTKDEYTRMKHQLNENVKFLKKNYEKSWFIKKWLYRSLTTQYNSILGKHFSD